MTLKICMIFFTSLFLTCHIFCQKIKAGMVCYKVESRIQNNEMNLPLGIQFSEKDLSATIFEQVAFNNFNAVSFDSEKRDFLKKLGGNKQITYVNTKKIITTQNFTKFKKSFTRISAFRYKLIKKLPNFQTICGLKCQEIEFKNNSGALYRGWLTDELPASAGCIWLKNSTHAVIKYETEKTSIAAIEISSKTNFSLQDLLPHPNKVIFYDTLQATFEYAGGIKQSIVEDKKFDTFDFFDFQKNKYSQPSFKKFDATIITIWSDFDWESYGVNFLTNRDFTLVKALDDFIGFKKLNVLHLALTAEEKDVLMYTNPKIKE